MHVTLTFLNSHSYSWDASQLGDVKYPYMYAESLLINILSFQKVNEIVACRFVLQNLLRSTSRAKLGIASLMTLTVNLLDQAHASLIHVGKREPNAA